MRYSSRSSGSESTAFGGSPATRQPLVELAKPRGQGRVRRGGGHRKKALALRRSILFHSAWYLAWPCLPPKTASKNNYRLTCWKTIDLLRQRVTDRHRASIGALALPRLRPLEMKPKPHQDYVPIIHEASGAMETRRWDGFEH